MKNSNKEILADIRNKLTMPATALEKISKGGKVPNKFLKEAYHQFKIALGLINKVK